MNLKNYTSETPAINSMGKIERSLVEAGATHISKEYKDGVCVAFYFQLIVNNKPISFRLPAKVEECFKVMLSGYSRPNAVNQKQLRAQAERTGWKIICDWVEVQLSMIRLEQAEPLQIFLPYAYDFKSGQTFYERIQDGGFKLLTQ